MKIRRWLSLFLSTGILLSTLPRAQAIVGYYNLSLPAGFSLIANQLDVFPTNTLNVALTNGPPPDGTSVFLWNTTNQSFTQPSAFYAGLGWGINYDISPGKGFMIWSPSSWTATFVGQVLTGTNTIFVIGTNKLSLLADKVPLAGTLATNLLFPLIDSASVYVFNTGTQGYLDPFSGFGGFGWFDPKGVVGINGPSISVGQSFFVHNPGPGTNWTEVLNPNAFVPVGPAVTSFAIDGDKLVLKINNAGAPYNVQFSTDRISWQTIATNQTSDVWTGPYPRGKQGYYQAVNP